MADDGNNHDSGDTVHTDTFTQQNEENPAPSQAPILAEENDIQPAELEPDKGREPTKPQSGSEPRWLALAPEPAQPKYTAVKQSLQVEPASKRASTMSGRSLDPDKLSHIRESIQPSIADAGDTAANQSLQVEPASNRESTMSGRSLNLDKLFHIRESVQLSIADAAVTASTSTHTLTHSEAPDEVVAFSRLHNSNSKPTPTTAGTVTFTTLEEKDIQHNKRRSSLKSIDFSDEETIVAWEENDTENPYNWPSRKKARILITALMLILNSTMGSALPSSATPFIAAEWGVISQSQKVLPISVYLIGYVMGPILWAPLSEQYGRKRISVGTFVMFCLFTLACALSPTWASFLIFRLFTGVFASPPLAIVTGIIADIYGDPRTRGRSMGIFMASTVFGPLLAPIISGFCATTIGWRWAFWIALMYAGVTLVPLIFMPETFSPVLLLRRARNIRRRNPSAKVIAPHELDKKNFRELTTVVCTRPIRMLISEPIVNTSCAYLALCYAIFYMSFEAFPIIFQGVYKLSPGMCGLTYLSIGVGSLLALPVFFLYDNILQKARERDASWTHQEEYRRLPLACIGGPMFVISLFWLGWTSKEGVPMAVPLLAGIPFGLGFMCVFQALLNYLTDAYEIFAASAQAASSTTRSLLATVLPLATTPMFVKLGISWSCSVLGGVSLLMCAIPFFFLWQGDKIRANSGYCIALRQRKEEMARKIDEQRRRSRRVTCSERMTVSSGDSSDGTAVERDREPGQV